MGTPKEEETGDVEEEMDTATTAISNPQSGDINLVISHTLSITVMATLPINNGCNCHLSNKCTTLEPWKCRWDLAHQIRLHNGSSSAI